MINFYSNSAFQNAIEAIEQLSIDDRIMLLDVLQQRIPQINSPDISALRVENKVDIYRFGDESDESVFKFINSLTIDYEIGCFDGCNLILIGASNLTYAHQIEILFTDVSYIRFPTRIFDPIELRFATHFEKERFKHLELAKEENLFAISCPSSFYDEVYFIAAERVRARKCQVYHYI